MKFDELRSIAHNVADSLASGLSLLVNRWDMEIFEEARRSPEGFITVDFLTGATRGGVPSSSLARDIALFPAALADLCRRHGTTSAVFKELTTRYSVEEGGRRFQVTVADHYGRRSADEYDGNGRRLNVLDSLGRVRRKKGSVGHD
jgi:hypothetical protein